ncbi:hypothetical protein BDY19DRAFT_888756, partial [Irpex rosettiformis]
MPSLWALVVSIKDYGYPRQGWAAVDGAHIDAANVKKYLQESMKVPPDHIRHLIDGQASRVKIISTFTDHLIHNPHIKKGDALLFYYSGHGSYVKTPIGWTVVEGKTGDEALDDMVEVILPWDEGGLDKVTGSPIHAIPDRTLAILIDQAAELHGNNITIVLDCCSSGHGTRG